MQLFIIYIIILFIFYNMNSKFLDKNSIKNTDKFKKIFFWFDELKYIDIFHQYELIFPFSLSSIFLSFFLFFLLLYSTYNINFFTFILRPLRFYIWEKDRKVYYKE
jgi:hypothetical protein